MPASRAPPPRCGGSSVARRNLEVVQFRFQLDSVGSQSNQRADRRQIDLHVGAAINAVNALFLQANLKSNYLHDL